MFRTLIVLSALASCAAFAPSIHTRSRASTALSAQRVDARAAAAAVATVLAGPAMALAQAQAVVDEAQYGTVEAPAWVLPVGALIVVSTAGLVPLFLKGGEEAQKAMAERDADVFDRSNSRGYLDDNNKKR